MRRDTKEFIEESFETMCDFIEVLGTSSFLFPVHCLMLVIGIIFTAASGHDNGWWMSEKRIVEINSMKMELHRINPKKVSMKLASY